MPINLYMYLSGYARVKKRSSTHIHTARETGGVLEFIGGFDDQGPLQVNSADGIHILSMNVNMSQ